MGTLKIIIISIIGGLVAYLQPVHNAMLVLGLAFMADVFFGILTDGCVNKKRFIPKKFILAFFYVAIYLSIVASIYVIGEHMGDAPESLVVVKAITYVFIYFYASNTLRNLCRLFPNNRPIAFLDYAFGLEFIKHIPALSDFLKQERHENH